MGLKIDRVSSAAPSAADTYLWLKVAAGSKLKVIMARNNSLGSRRVIPFLAPSSSVDQTSNIRTGTPQQGFLPLNQDTVQKSQDDYVGYIGELTIEESANVVGALFIKPDSGDILDLIIGYE